jgi:glycosyltransferase involved in cell wall biosynthesis
VFVINSLGLGGAERVLVNLLGAMNDERRSRISGTVILLDREQEVRQLPDHVVKHVLDSRRSLMRSIIGLRKALRRIRPDLVVSFLVRANVASSLVCKILGINSILCERMHLSSHLEGRYRGIRLVLAKSLSRIGYRLASRAVGVSEGVSEGKVAAFGADPRRTSTMVNPFDLAFIERESARLPEFDLPERFIVAAGRLEKSKGMNVLIDAFVASGLEHDLVILGEGSQRPALEEQIKAAEATARIHLPGYALNPFAILSRAQLYVSASTNEGFPNALVEAMALGVPVISTDCRSGPAEILAGVTRMNCSDVTFADHGVLVPENDAQALASAIRSVLLDPALRGDYAGRARRRAQDFSIEKIAEQMWEMIEGAAQAGSNSR